ncbi:MAG: hypothetical protein R2724_09455 [Bryobacterales bacterium]
MHFLLRADSAEGTPLLRLSKDDLKVTIDAQPAKLANIEGPSSPIIVIVVLDLVDDLNSIDAARSKLGEMASEMGKEQYLALMRAQDGLQVILDPTTNRRQFVEKARGGAGDGISRVARYGGAGGFGRECDHATHPSACGGSLFD